MGRGAWRATVHGAAKNQTRLSEHTHIITPILPRRKLWPQSFRFKVMGPEND